jgi:hypothetical protein
MSTAAYDSFLREKATMDVPIAEAEAIAPTWDLFPWQTLLVDGVST